MDFRLLIFVRMCDRLHTNAALRLRNYSVPAAIEPLILFLSAASPQSNIIIESVFLLGCHRAKKRIGAGNMIFYHILYNMTLYHII